MEKTIGEYFGRKGPTPRKGKLKPESTSNDSLIAGVELEIENLPAGRDAYAIAVGGAWDVVDDGSLRPRGQAWEFVSKPMHLSILIPEIEAFFKALPLDDHNYSDRCSVHVHTNVSDFTREQLSNLALVYPVFEAVLFRFVNFFNTENQNRDTNLYCIPWSSCLHNKNIVEKILSKPEYMRDWEKYTALNFAPIREKGSVEWRHMHGTNDLKKLTIWINMIGAIMAFCRDNSFEDITKIIKSLNDVSAYQQFFEAVLKNTIEYREEYRAAMAEGVIHGKLSLMQVNKSSIFGEPDRRQFIVDGIRPAPREVRNWGVLHDAMLLDELQPQIVPERPRAEPLGRLHPARPRLEGVLVDAGREAPRANPIWVYDDNGGDGLINNGNGEQR